MSCFFVVLRRFSCLLLSLALGFALVGCGKFSDQITHKKYVYVSSRKAFLRERLAAVTNRVADLHNGERLQVLDRQRRFYKVKTADGAVGWIDDLQVIDQADYDKFTALAKEHAHDPVLVTGILRDSSNLHIAPGRKEEHLFVLPENTHLELLKRASMPKPLPPQARPKPLPDSKKTKEPEKKEKPDPNAPPYVPPGPPMEDWWLVRGSQGQTGWVLSRMMDIVIPREIAGMAGTQRYVAAYKLSTMSDPESKFPGGQAPNYVVVTNSWKQGLPYDFDQLHVLTWVTRHHRYELSLRQRGIEGYLPITIGTMVFNGETVPTFSFRQATNNRAVQIDPVTGAAVAGHYTTVTYRLAGNLVYKVDTPGESNEVAKAGEKK